MSAPSYTSALKRNPPKNFLSLAPSTSESYPRTQKVTTKTTPALTADALAQIPVQEDAALKAAAERRESTTSTNSSKSGLRFLKLGPVHWGEHQDENKGDWHEAVVE